MSKEVLILTGACGVGKTQTAKEWAKNKNGVIIECDKFREWEFKKDFPKWTEEEEIFFANLAVLVATEYLNNGLNVAIDNVWSPKGIEIIRAELFRFRGIKVNSVRLICDKEENHKRDQQRFVENQMKERVDIVNAELNEYFWPNYVNVIDTADMSIETVVAEIEKA